MITDSCATSSVLDRCQPTDPRVRVLVLVLVLGVSGRVRRVTADQTPEYCGLRTAEYSRGGPWRPNVLRLGVDKGTTGPSFLTGHLSHWPKVARHTRHSMPRCSVPVSCTVYGPSTPPGGKCSRHDRIPLSSSVSGFWTLDCASYHLHLDCL